jgi:spore coat polysaccharide biosynthesis protein SpsF (cytidylyltransferase family)
MENIHAEEIKAAKIEKAKIMRENGYDKESIAEDVWKRPNEWCQGTCGGFNTWESHNLGLDTCLECKFEAMH